MYIDSVWSVIFSSAYFGRTYFRPLGHKVPAEGRTGHNSYTVLPIHHKDFYSLPHKVLPSRKFMGLLFYCLLKKSKLYALSSVNLFFQSSTLPYLTTLIRLSIGFVSLRKALQILSMCLEGLNLTKKQQVNKLCNLVE